MDEIETRELTPDPEIPDLPFPMALHTKKALDIADVAAMFKCSRENIKRMARRGELPAFKFGTRWYVFEEDLERVIFHGRVQVSSAPHSGGSL